MGGRKAMRPVAHTLIDSVHAPMAQVFAFLTSPGHMPDWWPDCTGVEYEAPLKRGARFTAKFGGRATEFEVVDYAPPATFGWVERGERTGCKTFFRLDGADDPGGVDAPLADRLAPWAPAGEARRATPVERRPRSPADHGSGVQTAGAEPLAPKRLNPVGRPHPLRRAQRARGTREQVARLDRRVARVRDRVVAGAQAGPLVPSGCRDPARQPLGT